VDRTAAEEWIREHVAPVGSIEIAHERPWSKVLRVPIKDGVAWFKSCGPVQAFEPRMTAELYSRWPDRAPEILGYDIDRAWLLLADAGSPMSALGNPPELWLDVLPMYGELQRGEVIHVHQHLAQNVPDLRVATMSDRYGDLVSRDLPLEIGEVVRLRSFADSFASLCAELEAHAVPETVQHDDLHMDNVYQRAGQMRVLDWGDSSISHPFASLVVTFRFLEETNKLSPDDRWFKRLRDAYLEPWGKGFEDTFTLAMRVGAFAHVIAWVRQRDYLPDGERHQFDQTFAVVLRRALTQVSD
jgi:hypothetical protein